VKAVAEPTTRRAYLAAALQTAGGPVTTETAVQLLDGSPFATGRNTVRKALRGLHRHGALVIGTTADGRTTYHLISTTTGEDGRS
jgi:Fe2+ or Zn2+ uptake regulation protein